MIRLICLALASVSLAACDRGGAVKDDIQPTPPLEQMVEEPGDWSSLVPAVGQTPGQSAMLTKGPLVTDLNALLGEDAIAFRQRMNRAGPLHDEAGVLVTSTEAGPEAAYLIVDMRARSMEAGFAGEKGWTVKRTPGAALPTPPSVTALRVRG